MLTRSLRVDRLARSLEAGSKRGYQALLLQYQLQSLDGPENVGFGAGAHGSYPEYLSLEARLAAGYDDAAFSHPSAKLAISDAVWHLHGGDGVGVGGVLVHLRE